jgi:hypothetical protein
MRRLTGLVLPALLALAVLTAPVAALADDVADAGEDLVLAVEPEEGDGEGSGGGPDPMPRDAEDNPARELGGYDDLDVPFTWGAAFIMLFLGVGGLALLAGLYWLLVHRPAQKTEA